MAKVVLGLGSNVGDAAENIREAVRRLKNVLDLESASSLYASAPMYVLHQPPFVNAAIIGETPASPNRLLLQCKAIEQEMGRLARERNGPREIDIDLVAYGRLAYRFTEGGEVRLQIPHPRLSERRFVLLPLSEIAPEFAIPGMGPVKELLALTESQSEDVTRIEDEVLSIYRQG